MAIPHLAIVSMACRYPEAGDPERLWRNVLRGRRSFRPLPPERIDLAAYAASGRDSLAITPGRAGLLADWRFDRSGFRIPAAAFAATDLAHWLALETAVRSLKQFDGRVPVDPTRTAVVVANTLTGEFSRASALALRAPFLDSLLGEVAEQGGLAAEQVLDLRGRFADALFERLGEPNDETLAGGLANTIAGRIANHLDLKGGAFSVDAACASSLVAVATACEMLVAGRADAVLTGAVDLSLDPFELVGFSRVGALAGADMRVFDARAQGFWPGEGAAFALLMLADRARALDLPVLATIRGWGLSTDGAGGLTRPTVEGQVRAITRACATAGLDPADLDLVEAHGTGTPTGDPVEVRALAQVRDGARTPLPIGSIKANIGHTKAAAGFAGLIKMVAALGHRVIPPHISADIVHPVFAEVDHRIRIARDPEALPEGRAGRGGVSSFGFGGVNAHIVLEGPNIASGPVRHVVPRPQPHQDCELFLFAAADTPGLAAALEQLLARTRFMALSELADTAAALAEADLGPPCRAAIVAATPEQLAERLRVAIERLAGDAAPAGAVDGIHLGVVDGPPAIAFLFPGQAAPVRPDGGAWARRFPELVPTAPVAAGSLADTAVAQPAIAAASCAALELLTRVGVTASAALGHSLGELAALAWAGAIPPDALVALAAARGEAFARHAEAGGGMMRLDASAAQARQLLHGLPLAVACENGPLETILSGPATALATLAARADAAGIATLSLAVSHAFHHYHMLPAVGPWRAALHPVPLHPLQRRLLSSVTGDWLAPGHDLVELLSSQLTEPVRFHAALTRLAGEARLMIEVGPGRALSRLAREAGMAAVSVDAFGPSLAPLLAAIGAAFCAGAPIKAAALFADRDLEPVDLDHRPVFLENPCGRRGDDLPAREPLAAPVPRPVDTDSAPVRLEDSPGGLLDLVRAIVAREIGLEASAVLADDRFDTVLHLGSLAVSRIVVRVAKAAGAPAPRAPTEFAGATSRELADAITDLIDHGVQTHAGSVRFNGVRRWIRCYQADWVPAPDLPELPNGRPDRWFALAPGDLPAEPPPSALLIDARDDFESDTDGRMRQVFATLAAAAHDRRIREVAVVASGQPLSALLRSLALEGGFDAVHLVYAAVDVAESRIRQHLATAAPGYHEVKLVAGSPPLRPRFSPARPATRPAAAIGPDDCIWVTGGARGIAAECALALARQTGAGLIFSSRSAADSPDVAEVLSRAREAGLCVAHAQADVCDRDALASALDGAVRIAGRPTILLHAAAVNRPARIGAIDGQELAATLAPKVDGLRNAVDVAGPQLRRIYAFGSIIGRLGLAGETHYALANAMMADWLDRHGESRPDCLALAIEWSVWGGAGMGEALGVIERLEAEGVDSLGVDDAIAAFLELVHGNATGSTVVTSRFGPPPFLDIGPSPAVAPRFVDRICVHFPGVEIVTETSLWPGRDHCLVDHRVEGTMLHPGVMSLEAMAQVAATLTGAEAPVVAIESVSFAGALPVAEGGALVIRIAALLRQDGAVHVVIRSADDDFASDRAAAVFRFGDAEDAIEPPVACDDGFDARPLYGPLFFHGQRFRRLETLCANGSRSLSAVLRPPDVAPWFARFDDGALALGDPAGRDAALHALQILVGHRRVIPVSVGRIRRHGPGPIRRVDAREVRAEPGLYVFDIACRDAEGTLVEQWESAEFRAVGALDPQPVVARVPELLGPILERLAREMLDDDALVLGFGDGPARGPRRGDGRPLDAQVSRSHGGTGLWVAGSRVIGCDLEWLQSFGPEAPAVLAMAVTGAPLAAGEAWVAGEALRKLGLRLPVALAPLAAPGLPDFAQLFEAEGARVLVVRVAVPSGVLLAGVAEAPRDRGSRDGWQDDRRVLPADALGEPAE